MSEINKKRVVVTGIGMLSSLGKNKEDHIHALTDNELCTKNIKRFDVTHKFYRNDKAFCIDQEYLSEISKDDKTIQFSCAVHSINEAVEDAGLTKADLNDAALVVGSSIGSDIVLQNIIKNLFLPVSLRMNCFICHPIPYRPLPGTYASISE